MTRTAIITVFTFVVVTAFFLMLSFSNSSDRKYKPQVTFVCTPCNSKCDAISYNQGGICTHCNMPLIPNKKQERKKRIGFYLQDGVEILDFAGPMEVFSYAGFEVFTISKNKTPITTQGILKIVPDYSITEVPSVDILAFFGGNSSEAYKDGEVIQWVKSQKGIEYYFSVCTGAFILAEADLLTHKSATTFHNALYNFQERYPETNLLKNVRFVDNGTIVTTAGISAGIDGALHLVAKLKGFNAARAAAYYMEYDKWIPGEGLLLSEDNPYEDFMDIEKLKKYEGIYEYIDQAEVEIKINENEQSLFATHNGLKYPLFYHKNDTVTNLKGDKIIFKRDEKDIIKGYESSNIENKFFTKLQ